MPARAGKALNIGVETLSQTLVLRGAVNNNTVNIEELTKSGFKPAYIPMIWIIHVMGIAD